MLFLFGIFCKTTINSEWNYKISRAIQAQASASAKAL